MARKNIKRPRLNSRKRRKLRYAAAHANPCKEILLGFYDNVVNHLEDLQQGLEAPNEEVIRLDEEPVLKTGAGDEPV
jgi:hypothetical protein